MGRACESGARARRPAAPPAAPIGAHSLVRTVLVTPHARPGPFCARWRVPITASLHFVVNADCDFVFTSANHAHLPQPGN